MKNLDKLIIRDLTLRGIVGLREDERTHPQDLIINITLYVDLTRACRSDDIADSVDYVGIKKKIIAVVETTRYFLVEKLAQHIADVCLEDIRVKKVSVSVDKPTALRFAASVATEIIRTQQDDAEA